MDSLCNYNSDEEVDSNIYGQEMGVRHEDVNYDHLTMEMSDEELSPQQSSPQSTSPTTSCASNETNNDNQVHMKYYHPDKKSPRKSSSSRHSSRSPPYSSQSARKNVESFSERKKKHPIDSKHEKFKSKDEIDSSKGRRRSPHSHHHRERSRRSPSYGSRDKYSHRNESPPRRPREKERSRSPRRHPTAFERKTNKLTLLEKLGIEIKVPEEGRSIDSSLPGYYNPMIVNSTKYAEQVAKRKLLWSGKKQEQPQGKEEVAESKNCALWQGAKFSEDQDGKLTAKFHRLMGIKHSSQGESSNTLPPQDGNSKDLIKKQEEMFSSMELQYEVARAATHTQRGVGLGFGAHHFAR